MYVFDALILIIANVADKEIAYISKPNLKKKKKKHFTCEAQINSKLFFLLGLLLASRTNAYLHEILH